MLKNNKTIVIWSPPTFTFRTTCEKSTSKILEFSPYEWEIIKWHVIKDLPEEEINSLIEAKNRGESYSYGGKLALDKKIFSKSKWSENER